ncbi:unnamed protein product [Enterobius vermicularis]|uniref:FAS1 domain-containing protein n=1 Tax=Enterobius vermicularis TaxID=51028 RepID=A0A0N4VN96_ENTVE|nr:unnamed protein product [Enterobius vermicularis]
MFPLSCFIFFSIFSVTVQLSQFDPLIKRFTSDEFEQNPIGYAFAHLLDDSSPKQNEKIYTVKHSIDDSGQDDTDDYPNFGNVAGKKSRAQSLPTPNFSYKPQEQVNSQASGAITLGEHTCVRERRVEVLNPTDYVSCTHFDNAVRCVSGHGNFSTVRIVECCEGYRAENIHSGCKFESDTADMYDLLPNNTECFKSFSDDVVTSSTIFLPPDEQCSKEKQELDIKNYAIKGVYHDYDLLNGQRLRTKSGGYVIAQEASPGSKYGAALNCIEIKEVNAKDGILFKLSKKIEASYKTVEQYFASDSGFTVFRNHLIREHIFSGFHCSSRLNSSSISALSGNTHTFSRELINGTLTARVDNAKLLETDKVFTNGIVHAIDDVIFDQKFADWRDHLEIFDQEFLKLVEEINPNDDNISALIVPPKELLTNITDKKAFVLNHIVPIKTEKKNRKLISTAYGSEIPSTLNLQDSGHSWQTMIGCVALTKQSVRLCDTDIHFVEKVLPVVKKNLLELVNDRKDLSVFASFLANSSVIQELDLETPKTLYTLFVPSDDAFSKNQIKTLQRNETLAENFVRRHIFKGFICSLNATDSKADSLQNINDDIFPLYHNGDKTYIGDSAVDEADIIATNGIIQIIDNELNSQSTLRRSPYRSILDIFTF